MTSFRAPIDQRTDRVSRYVRVLPPVLCAIGGDASKITPDVATDVLFLLGEWELGIDAESPVMPAHSPVARTSAPPNDWGRVRLVKPSGVRGGV